MRREEYSVKRIALGMVCAVIVAAVVLDPSLDSWIERIEGLAQWIWDRIWGEVIGS